MPPKPGNAFAQLKEMERQTSQRSHQHTRDFSHDTTSSTRTVIAIPQNDPQEESSAGAGAQDIPDTPRTTMAMFTEESAPEERQETSQKHTTPLSKKNARKQKKKVETKRSSSTLESPLPERSSAMPEPLFSEKQSGLDFIKSTFSRGKKAFVRTTSASTSRPENTFSPFNFQHRRDTSQQSTQPDNQTAASGLKNTDPAVLYATADTSPRAGRAASHVSGTGLPSIDLPATTTQVSGLYSIHTPATTAQESALSSFSVPATTQQSTVSNRHMPATTLRQSAFSTLPVSATTSQQSAFRGVYVPVTTSRQKMPSSMQIPQSTIPDRYRLSTAYGQRDSNLPPFQPHTGMMPYSSFIPRRHDRPGHISTGTQQTYATTQSRYSSMNQNKGIILGDTSISPTRQGTYAIAGNAELVSRQSVTSMTGSVREVSPLSQDAQQQPLGYGGPFLPSTKYQPRLNAPLPSLPSSASDNQSSYRNYNIQYCGASAGNTRVSLPDGRDSAITGTWERMQAQHPDSMPQLSPALPQYGSTQPMFSDPKYFTTAHGQIPAALLYNYSASKDTKSEGQKSDLEAGEVTDDAKNVNHLLRKSGFRRAFSNSNLNAEAPVFISKTESVASSAGSPPTPMPQYNSPVAPAVIPAPHNPPRRSANNNTTTITTSGGPTPTPPHPAYLPIASGPHQVAASFAVMHHRLENDNRVLREHISRTMGVAQDKMVARLEGRIAALGRRLGGRVRALEGEVAALRQQIAEGSGALSSWPLPGAALSSPPPHIPQQPGPVAAGGMGRAGRGKGKGKGKERENRERGDEEVLWRRPVGGGMGEIGGGWYGEEVGGE